MDHTQLIPFIRGIESLPRLSAKNKQLLCLILTAMSLSPDGLTIKELGENFEYSIAGLYKVVVTLEKRGFIVRTIKNHVSYITINLETIEDMIKEQEAKKNLVSKTLKLRLASNKVK